MANLSDITINPTDCDLVFTTGGDLDVKINEQQHVEHILRADKGQFRQSPLVGVGIERFFKGPVIPKTLRRTIKLQLESDNYNVRQVLVNTDGEISIDAERIK